MPQPNDKRKTIIYDHQASQVIRRKTLRHQMVRYLFEERET
jgi:hypothetical protein